MYCPKNTEIMDLGHLQEEKTLKTDNAVDKSFSDSPSWGRIRIRIGIRMDSRIRIRDGINTMQIHNAAVTLYLRYKLGKLRN